MRVLVTGGAGFIGSHLVRRLQLLNHTVGVIDNLSNPTWIPEQHFYLADLCNNVDDIFDDFNPDFVFHLAANTNVPRSVENPLFDFKTLQGSMNVFSKGIPMIYLSSSFIYGDAKRPTKECEPFKLTAPYGIVKHACENYIEFYRKNYGYKYTVVRPATVYGPGQIGGAMADYIRKLKSGKQAVIYGDKTRDYVYVSDLVTALITLMELPSGEEYIYNIGTGKETRLRDLYLKIADILGVYAKPILEQGRKAEVERQCLNSYRMRKLGWKPKVGLDEGLKLTCR